MPARRMAIIHFAIEVFIRTMPPKVGDFANGAAAHFQIDFNITTNYLHVMAAFPIKPEEGLTTAQHAYGRIRTPEWGLFM